ncbi:MAG TPA: right-handed parallel beta-helix repeat-containing protein, partial [Chloroflexota bacterium]|nr:right-handed parallel beta-helix repeat-containing protein [Chloroflexota bacterium]
MTISGGGLSRVFQVDAGVTASLSGLTITDGYAPPERYTIAAGGGLLNYGTATLTDCTVSGNSAANGGGLWNGGTLTLINSTVSGNVASSGLINALVGVGGGLYNVGTLKLTDSTVSGNSASYDGGGLWNNGTLTMTDCTVSGNTSYNNGGGVDNQFKGLATLTNCTVSNNRTVDYGGGLYNFAEAWGGYNSDFYCSFCGSATFKLANTIVAGNNSGGRGRDVWGPFLSQGHNLIGDVQGSIADDPLPPQPSFGASDLTGDYGSPLLNPLLAPLGNYGGPTQTMPLLPGSPAINAGATGPGIPSADERGLTWWDPSAPDIGAFGPFGGEPFQNYVVNTRSDALDPGPGLVSLRLADQMANVDGVASTITFDPTVFATHQTITQTDLLHLVTSSKGTNFYYQVLALTAYGDVASAEVGAASDNQALSWNAMPGAYSYQIYRGTSGFFYQLLATTNQTSYTDSGATLTIGGPALAWLELSDTTSLDTITGPAAGVTINGGGLSQVFQINSGATASLRGLTITGGNSSPVELAGAVTINPNAALTLNQCTVSGNTGTGVYDSGTATLTYSTISGNTSGPVGGMKLGGGAATLTNCTISGNTGTNNGGIAANPSSGPAFTPSTVLLTNCTISGNTGTANTGGISILAPSTVSLINTIVAGNSGGKNPDVGGSLVTPKSATFTSLGHNLIGNGQGSTGWIASDLVGTKAAPLGPLLAPLGDYGGPTQTMPLLPGSPALGAGTVADVPGTTTPITTDQRGKPLDSPNPDIGAFQSQKLTISSISAVSPNPRSSAVSTIDVTLTAPINTSNLTTRALVLSDDGSGNLINSGVTISLVSGDTYAIGGLLSLTAADGEYTLTVSAADIQDQFGFAGTGTASVSWLMDTTPPTSTINSLPAQTTSTTFSIPVSATDPVAADGGAPSGLAEIAVYVSVNGGPYSLLGTVTPPGDPASYTSSVAFTGQVGDTYGFFSVATDAAGNVPATLSRAQQTVQIVSPLFVSSIASVSPNPRNSAVSSIDVAFSEAINTSSLTVGALTLTDNGGANLINSGVTLSLVSGDTYAIGGLSGLTTAQAEYTLSVNAADIQDQNGSAGTGTFSTSWLMDTTPPTSTVNPLPARGTSLSFPVSVTGSDGGNPPSGLASYAIYVSVNGGSWSLWKTIPASNPTAAYTGQSNTTYAFYSIATDNAGNVEIRQPVIEASTYLPDLTPPVTSVDG